MGIVRWGSWASPLWHGVVEDVCGMAWRRSCTVTNSNERPHAHTRVHTHAQTPVRTPVHTHMHTRAHTCDCSDCGGGAGLGSLKARWPWLIQVYTHVYTHVYTRGYAHVYTQGMVTMMLGSVALPSTVCKPQSVATPFVAPVAITTEVAGKTSIINHAVRIVVILR